MTTFTVVDHSSVASSGLSTNVINKARAGIEDAASIIDRYIAPTGVDIEILFKIENVGALATGGTGFSFTGFEGPGQEVWELDSLSELVSGNESPSNQDTTDITITVDRATLTQSNDGFYFETDPVNRTGNLPSESYDYLTIMVHEMLHGLGFLAVAPGDPNGYENPNSIPDVTPFDQNVGFFGGSRFFLGDNAVEANGGNVILLSDFSPTSSHVASVEEGGINSISNALIRNGDKQYLGPVEIGMLQDIGVNIRTATSGNDELYGFFGRGDTLSGGGGADTLHGLTGDDRLYGEGGLDRLEGGNGNDLLDAGAGVAGGFQTLNGGRGNDRYIYSKEDLNVRIGSETSGTGQSDRLELTNLNQRDIRVGLTDAALGQQALELIWTDENSTASGRVELARAGQFIESYRFANGGTVDGIADFVDVNAEVGNTVTQKFGNGFDGKTAPDGSARIKVGGVDETMVIRFDGFDIDFDDELEVFLNGDSLGFVEAGQNNGFASYQLSVSKGDYNDADNILEFHQAINPNYKWGVTNVSVTESNGIVLEAGVLETGSFGHRFNGERNSEGVVTATFTGTGENLNLSFAGFDVDTDDELEVILNGTSLGFVGEGVNQGLENYEFAIAAGDQNLGENLIEFRQAINPGYAWGVTDILVAEVTADFTLERGVTETDAFGHRIQGIRDTDGVATASFSGTGTDLLLSFDGFDVDFDNEIEVVVNGNSRGFIEAGQNQALEGYEIAIGADEQVAGGNLIEFRQAINPGYAWGVTNVLLENLNAGIRLTTGTTETGSFGNKFNGTRDNDGVVKAVFSGTGSDLLLSFDGFDVDFDNEIEVVVNGNSRGLLSAGVNGGLEGYVLAIGADEQALGDNVVEFRQAINTNFAWGITNVQVENLDTDFRLENSSTETGSFGHRFDGVRGTDGLVSAVFTGTGSDLALSFKGFDIDTDAEVELLVNGDSFGFLDAGLNQGLEEYAFEIAAADQYEGDNLIEFRQAIDPGYAWGITEVLIDDSIL